MSALLPGVSNRHFARLDGCDEARVRTGKKRGELPVLPDGRLDPKLAGTGWRARNQTADTPPCAVTKRNRQGVRTLAEEHRRREIALARLRQHELRRRSDEWALRTEIAAAWHGMTLHAHGKIQAIIPAMTKGVAACSTMVDMQITIHDIVYAVLTDLAGTRAESAIYDDEPPPPIPDDASKLEAETAKVGALASLRQLDVDITTGLVVNVREFARVLGDALSRVRQRLLSLEAVLPPRLHGARVVGRGRIIRQAVMEALAELPTRPVLPGFPLTIDHGDTDVTTDDD
jgi:hypothetical protein